MFSHLDIEVLVSHILSKLVGFCGNVHRNLINVTFGTCFHQFIIWQLSLDIMKYEYMFDIYYLVHWFAHHQYVYPSNNEASSWVKEIETFIQLNHNPLCNSVARLMTTPYMEGIFYQLMGLFLMFHFYIRCPPSY